MANHPPLSGTYYNYTSIIPVKKWAAQPKQVDVKGVWFPEFRNGLQVASTGDTDYYEPARYNTYLMQLGREKGGNKIFRGDQSVVAFKQLGTFKIPDDGSAEGIRNLTQERISELLRMLRNGTENRDAAIAEIQNALRTAQKLSTASQARHQ